MGGYEPIFIQPILLFDVKIQLQTTNRMLEQDVRKQLRACPPFPLLPVYIPSRERTHKDRLPVIIPARDLERVKIWLLNVKI